jgi:DNA-binding SARP family transcriptional activator
MDGWIEGRDGGYVLAATPEEVDAARFEALVKHGKAQIASDPAAAAATLSDALSLWRADALADMTDEPSLRLEELRLSATEHRIAAEIEMGGHSTVVSDPRCAHRAVPTPRTDWANLMLALYRLGRRAESLAAYQQARQVLADELGTEPSRELQRLNERILRRDPSLGLSEPARQAVRPSRLDRQPGSLEVGQHQDVEQLGAGSGTERV